MQKPPSQSCNLSLYFQSLATKASHAKGFRSANHLEKKIDEDVDGKEKRYRMGGSPRDEMFRGRYRKVMQVIDL
jgi:hypothetical protein